MKTTRKSLRVAQSLALGLTLLDGSWGLCVAWGQVPANVAGIAAPGASMPMAAPLNTKIFPLAEVRRGQRGVAYTVFEGVVPEPMEVEILGVLKDSLGPGQDMILARLHGTKPEYTGVVAGMSGSPVYIDGRLAGALSYRIGQFSKDPIAGITPIELMLGVRDGAGGQAAASAALGPLTRGSLAAQEDSSLAGGRVSRTGMEMQAMETPLVFGGGFSQEAVERFGERFRGMGLTPVAGLGGSDSGAAQPEPLVPGSAVSAVLVRGDLSMAGTCTVTYVDPTRLLACGHPITQFGRVDMPMTKANVVATLASPLNAFKIVNTTETVGAFTEDRASAIMGQFGMTARMIPVTVEVVPDAKGVAERTLHFEVLDNRQLTPSAMLVSVYQSLQGTNISAADMSYLVKGELTLEGQPPVKVEGLMTQNEFNPGAVNAALMVGDRFNRVYENALEPPVVLGLRLRVEAIPERKTAVLETARLSRSEVRAGDEVEVEARMRPYRSEARVVRVKFKLPASVSPGPVRVAICDGATVDRLMNASGVAGQRAIGLSDAVIQINRLHANNALYVILLDHVAQAVLDSGALSGVPLSMVNVLEPLKESQKMQLTGESVLEAGSAKMEYAVSGSQVLTLMVR